MKKAFLLIAFLTLIISYSISAANDYKTIVEKTLNVSSGELLDLEADFGDVKIESWSKEQVYVKITGNDNAEEKLKYNIEKTSEGVLIKIEKKGSGFWGSIFNNMRLRIQLNIPENFNTEIKTAGGDIIANSIRGKNKFMTSGGDIELKNNTGDLRAITSGGDVKVTDHKGRMELKTSGGDVIARNTEGSLETATSGGDIDLEASEGKISAKTSGGDIALTYSGSNEGIELRTSGGDIRLVVPSSTKASVKLKTSGGDIELESSNLRASKIKSSEVTGELNGGGPELIAKTSGGDINFREI